MAVHTRVLRTVCAVCLSAFLSVGCGGDSSGPSDTTITLDVDDVTSPTNQADQTITGTVDGNSEVTITSPVDTVEGTASTPAPIGGQGTFSLTVTLAANTSNDIEIEAVDPAGNRTSRTVTILHDNIAPTATIVAPTSAGATAGQTGFLIDVDFSDESSGVDAATVEIENDGAVGGVFQQDGTLSTTFTPGTNLAPLFSSVSGSGATVTVADSTPFPPQLNDLTVRVSDLAGNQSADESVTFNVTADPDKVIVVNSSGAAGSAGNPVVIGLANADLVSGVQFDLTFDAAVIASVDAVTATDRAVSFSSASFNQIMPGQVRVLLFDLGGDMLSAGQGAVLTISVTVDAGAPSGAATLTVESILLSDDGGATSSLSMATGTFTVP